MLLPAPPLRLRKPRANPFRVPKLAPTPVVTGPVLVAAAYNAGDLVLTLTFDRAVDIGGIVVDEFLVLDGNLGIEMGGTAGDLSQPTPESVAMFMIENAPYEGEGVKLTVTGANGIIAVEGGAPWVGVTDVDLPFPS